MIWRKPIVLEELNAWHDNTLQRHIGIEFIETGDDYIKATMPVDHRTQQPMGLLHGGASVALAESLGSVASVLCVDITQKMVVGLEINANHIKAAEIFHLIFCYGIVAVGGEACIIYFRNFWVLL